jgi:hypothetical protein
MYAIKIVSSEYIIFHQADEITYKYISYSSKEDFDRLCEELDPSYILGEYSKNSIKEKDWCLYLNIYNSKDISNNRHIMILSDTVIYVMQDGNTIEVIKID